MKLRNVFFTFLVFVLFSACENTGLDGQDGTAGANGTDGVSAVVRTTPEEAGVNCPYGGTFVELGVGEEVTSSYYACNLPGALEYKVGDEGPSGGYIFYVNPNYLEDGWTYLEAAPASTETTNDWGATGSSVGQTYLGIGKGEANTVLAAVGGSYAADDCDTLDVDGVTDWFLPSLSELALMRQNLFMEDLGAFTTNYYWSSSEYDAVMHGYRVSTLATSTSVIRILLSISVVPGLFNYLTIS